MKTSSYALLIGVGQRPDDSPYMAISGTDAGHLETALKQLPSFSHIFTKSLKGENASRTSILGQFGDLATKTKNEPADLIIIYFSGHGCRYKNDYYLVCNDTSAGDLEGTGITGSLFTELLNQLACQKLLVLLDCCHASGVGNVAGSRSAIPFNENAFADFKKSKNKVIITACKSNQVSYLSRPVSLFTYAVIEGLGGKFLTDTDDKEVNVFNLAMGVRERVIALSNEVLKVENAQQPELNVINNGETTNFSLAFYPEGDAQKIKLFDEEFSALKAYDGKQINLDVKTKKDEAYREQFKWIISNVTVQEAGDGGVNVKDSHGNSININNGLSDSTVKEIFNRLDAKDKVITALVALLQNKADGQSKELLVKVKRVASVSEKQKKNLEEQLDLLTEKKNMFEQKRIINADPGTDFYLIKEIEKMDLEIDRVKEMLNNF